MDLWKLSSELGLWPYPGPSYLTLARTTLPLFLGILWVKSHLLSDFDKQFDKIQGALYLNRGTFELAMILLHNWKLAKNNKDLEHVMLAPGIQKLTAAYPVLLAILTNFPEIVFIIHILYGTKFEQPLNTGNLCMLTVDNMITFIMLQYYFILKHLSGLIEKETNSKRDLHERAQAVYDIVETGRCVESIFTSQNFMLVLRVYYSTLYALYMFIRFPLEHFLNRSYRLANVLTHFANLFYIVEASSHFRRQAKKFNKRLFKEMREMPHLCKDRKLVMFALAKKNVVFTGAKCFQLNYSLLKTVLAVAASYFIVMDQFKSVSDPSEYEDEDDE